MRGSTGLTAEREAACYQLARMVNEGKHTRTEMRVACRMSIWYVDQARKIWAQEGEVTGDQIWQLRVAKSIQKARKVRESNDAIRRQKLAKSGLIAGWQIPAHSPRRDHNHPPAWIDTGREGYGR